MDLPCESDGVCMRCKAAPPEGEVLHCRTCATPWHVQCLSTPPATMASAAEWECPDCFPSAAAADAPVSAASGGDNAGLIASIRAIEADSSLTDQEKAKRRQELMGRGKAPMEDDEDGDEDEGNGRKKAESNDVLDLLDDKFKCAGCMKLPERPVTTPCGHNFCLTCFQKWAGQSKTCIKCRAPVPSNIRSQPRINLTLVMAIRMAKTARTVASGGPANVYHFTRNENKPEKAYTTERAKKTGKANACSGQIFVTVPPDHFGPIHAENDPKRNRGLLVGDSWEDRMECRQWGAHLPHVAGIAGQSDFGAQSVALSGGYEDDEDHGEWFLYTGSGGRDLSGNKRTNKAQSFDQKFDKSNEALRVSCKKGYPVRVVRSHKEKRSSYAPESGVRYDGIYRIEKCWRKVGIQGFKVCRYLFVRCDNEPAPWTSDEHGDRPRPLPSIKELKNATDVTTRNEIPAWDYDEKHGWKWMKPQPVTRKAVVSGDPGEGKIRRKAMRVAQNLSVRERLLKEFSCLICRKVMTSPLTTPCAHNFCKSCLLGSYVDQSFVRVRTQEGGRTLWAQKIVKRCPSCPTDISDFLQNSQVNREMMDLIETLQRKSEEEIVGEAGGNNETEQAVDNGFDNMLNTEDGVEASKLNKEEHDDVKKCDASDGNSNGNADSEIEEGCEEEVETLPGGDSHASGKRKKVFAWKISGKKAKKSEETGTGDNEIEDVSGAENHNKCLDESSKTKEVSVSPVKIAGERGKKTRKGNQT